MSRDFLFEITFVWLSNRVRLAVPVISRALPPRTLPSRTPHLTCVFLFIFIVGRHGEEVVQDYDVDGWVVVLVYVEECL